MHCRKRFESSRSPKPPTNKNSDYGRSDSDDKKKRNYDGDKESKENPYKRHRYNKEMSDIWNDL